MIGGGAQQRLDWPASYADNADRFNKGQGYFFDS
jgi:hypothetical protein